jgi:hypothetical protein
LDGLAFVSYLTTLSVSLNEILADLTVDSFSVVGLVSILNVGVSVLF